MRYLIYRDGKRIGSAPTLNEANKYVDMCSQYSKSKYEIRVEECS